MVKKLREWVFGAFCYLFGLAAESRRQPNMTLLLNSGEFVDVIGFRGTHLLARGADGQKMLIHFHLANDKAHFSAIWEYLVDGNATWSDGTAVKAKDFRNL